ncbi:hypothetical protein KUTeg_011911 [Tegillarca granosa]|uniref:EGF-like domain-containing protein n=1 Tax=Tegillarca granosa TaxID=220873 RepID=A0ABQ9F1G7_TEGGR|nr:hypothetical protein KUTeg_011911 [Tegillarca granosa]
MFYFKKLGARKESGDCQLEYICKLEKGTPTLKQYGQRKPCHKLASCAFDETGHRKCICTVGYGGDGYSCIAKPEDPKEEEDETTPKRAC